MGNSQFARWSARDAPCGVFSTACGGNKGFGLALQVGVGSEDGIDYIGSFIILRPTVLDKNCLIGQWICLCDSCLVQARVPSNIAKYTDKKQKVHEDLDLYGFDVSNQSKNVEIWTLRRPVLLPEGSSSARKRVEWVDPTI